MKPTPPIDRRDAFAVRRTPRNTEADLVITIRTTAKAARWVPRHRVKLSTGEIKEQKP